ncbi:Eukaryotic translation initiation factor 4E type 2 [Linnemannia zychae]|nr:Eukaryotic translation initiation factor 4E type 2 [Linnemannia zychae]
MEQAWGPRKSARAQGESAPGGSSKLVQLQRLNSSASVLGGGPASAGLTTPTTSGPLVSGSALDFTSRGESGHNSSKPTASSGNQSSGAASGTGSSGASAPASASGPVTGSGAGAGVSGAVVGGAGTTAMGLTSGSLHPLHFNWVFWFMHRAPGSKILNYESSMKKIATFGSVEDFWAVYSHLKRPHELPNVSDYHLFKQGVRPVWEDATNINGGKWIVRLKKGLASRYWENLIMAVIGDQFDVGSEICGVVLSIRGGEDILSLWNQSAHEGRINLKIRDTMKRVLNLPAETIMEYKTHNDALKDNTSFRNTDVFSTAALHSSLITQRMLGLLPHDIVAILDSEPQNNTQPDPARLHASLTKINTSTWLRLGAVCHNEGFAAEVSEWSTSQKTAGSSTKLSDAQLNQILYLENGMPRIINTIQRHCRRDPQVVQDEALLWRMYLLYRKHMPKANNKKRSSRSRGLAQTATNATTPPWQLEFIKSACPEIMIIAFHDIFMEHGERAGFEINIPKVLVEALDYEWGAGSSAAKRSVQALIQLLQGCLRYRKIGPTEAPTASTEKSVGLGVGESSGSAPPGETHDESSAPIENENIKSTRQMVLNLAEANAALQVFLESEAGQNFPKLREAFTQELEEQKQKLGEKPVKKVGGLLGYTPSPDSGTARKRVDIIMGDETPEGSPSLLSSPHSTFTMPTWHTNANMANARKNVDDPKRTGADSEDPASRKKLRTAASLVEYAVSGSWPDSNPTSSTHQAVNTPTARTQAKLAKLNNPLWSPILSLNFFPQAPNKYEVQLESELERWISLCGHMDGAVFADKLVSLIKDVYPSDQKFLLEQILVEFMCWDETEGRERDSGEMAVYSSVNSGDVCQLTKPAPRIGFKSAERAVDTIMGALVALVIKPEDNLSHVIRKTHRWLQPIELVSSEESLDRKQEAVEDLSVRNTDAKGRKRKTRNLYNRRVSPFYSILSLFKPRRVEGRVTGMLYLTEQDIKDRTAERNSQQPSATTDFEIPVRRSKMIEKSNEKPSKVSKLVSKVPPPTPSPKPTHAPTAATKAVAPPTPQATQSSAVAPNVQESAIVPGVGAVTLPDFAAIAPPPSQPSKAVVAKDFYGIGATDPTYFSPELMMHLGPEVMEGITEPSPDDRMLLTKAQAKRLKRMRQKHTKMKKAAEDLGEVYVPVMTGQYPGAEIFVGQIVMPRDDDAPSSPLGGTTTAATAKTEPHGPTEDTNVQVAASNEMDVDMEAPPGEHGDAAADQVEPEVEEMPARDEQTEEVEVRAEPSVQDPVIESEDLEMSEGKTADEQPSEQEVRGVATDGDQVMSDSTKGQEEEVIEDVAPQMMGELTLNENLRLAKQAESMRMECHAPFRVLLRILQYLTRANQGAMLDLWIIDSVSDTVEPLQVIYFEWMLRELIDTSPRPSSSPLKIDHDESIQLEEEILRLIPLLIAAPTIGYGPAVAAFRAVERSQKGKAIPRLGGDAHSENLSYWERARLLLEL